jgi:hypothetical protein
MVGLAQGLLRVNGSGKSVTTLDYYDSTVRSTLSFFMKPRLRAETDIGTAKLDEPTIVRMIGKTEPQPQFRRIRFVNMGIINDGRTLAQDSTAHIKVRGERGRLLYGLRWEKPLTDFDFAAPFLQSILARFPEKADIQAGPGRLLTILFTYDSGSKAFLTTDRLRTLEIPSETDIVLTIGGSNFTAQTLGTFHISIRSWNDIHISEVTVLTQLHDAIRNLALRLRAGFASVLC